LQLTTSAALIIVRFCGVLCGKGHAFTPVATAVITAVSLARKQPITGFATDLSDIELRSAAAHHQVSFLVAANGAVLAALTSVLINIPIVARAGGQLGLTKPLAHALLIVTALGALGLLVHKPLETAFHSMLRIRNKVAATTH
jgi:uncharacterized membrane protein (DUF4010 family)